MKKIDWNHAITRKDYLVLCGWSFGLAVLIYAALAIWVYWSHIKAWTSKMKDKIRAKLPW